MKLLLIVMAVALSATAGYALGEKFGAVSVAIGIPLGVFAGAGAVFLGSLME